VFASVLLGSFWIFGTGNLRSWHAGLLAAGLAAVVPALLRWWRRGDPDAIGPLSGPWWRWRRLRLVLTAGAALAAPLPFVRLGTEQIAGLFGVSTFALQRHGNAQIVVVGAMTLAVVVVLAAVAGLWSLAGALTAATTLVAISASGAAGDRRGPTGRTGAAGWAARWARWPAWRSGRRSRPPGGGSRARWC
jgi:hypothetical protein